MFSGTAGGKFATAALMNKACEAFGFPFRRVKCCREMGCKCMHFQLKIFATKRLSADGANMALCNDSECGHQKDRHYELEMSVEALVTYYIIMIDQITIVFHLQA